MNHKLAASFLLGILLAAGAHAQTREVQQEKLERYLKYAGDPIEQFNFWSMYKWSLVGPTKVVVWPNINEAYLLTVEDPCPGLEWAKGIGVTSKQSRTVSSRFDFVTYGKAQCQIKEIRPIDYKRMIKDGPEPKDGGGTQKKSG
jgi:uncharacterized protein DUF6491